VAYLSPDFPDTFSDKLERTFRGRLRIRWSSQLGEWHIEQRVRRAFVDGQRPKKKGWDESRDEYVRYRDGYVHILSVRTGDRMPCPKCSTDLKVPYNRTEVIKCAMCHLRGKQSFVPAMFVPLNDVLIGYLQNLDPENDASERLNEDVDRANALLAQTMERDALNAGESEMLDRYNRIVGIPQFGYSGKTKAWKAA